MTAAWSVLVRLVRRGPLRQLVILLLFAWVVVGIAQRDYDLATLALVWVVYLDLQDPHRSGRVIVIRRRDR